MKLIRSISLLSLTLILVFTALTACAKSPEEDVPTDPFGVTLSVKDVTPTGLTLVVKQSGGAPTGTLRTAAAFRLDKGVYDNWVYLNTVLGEDEEYVWDTASYAIEMGGVTEIALNWTDLYGELPAGAYRLAKGVSDVREDGTADAFTYFVEFEITE